MFRDKERLEVLKQIDKKLSQILAILHRESLKPKKGDKKDV